jgi:hypothetical protein
LATNSSIQARICSADDLDYFRFTPNASGSVAVTVAASDTPLRVQFGTTSSDVPLSPIASVNVAAGAKQTLTALATSGVQYFILVTPNGTLGTDGGYTVSTTYPFTWPARRRAARR